MVGYIIKNSVDVTAAMWAVCLCSEDTARKSNDETLVLLKFESEDIPPVFQNESVLTVIQAQVELEKPQWTHTFQGR